MSEKFFFYKLCVFCCYRASVLRRCCVGGMQVSFWYGGDTRCTHRSLFSTQPQLFVLVYTTELREELIMCLNELPALTSEPAVSPAQAQEETGSVKELLETGHGHPGLFAKHKAHYSSIIYD